MKDHQSIERNLILVRVLYDNDILTSPNSLHHRKPRDVLQRQPLPLPTVLVSTALTRLALPNLSHGARVVAAVIEECLEILVVPLNASS